VASRRKGVRRTPLEIVEQLATERFGVGSAISVDRFRACDGGRYYVATAWRPTGHLGVASSGHAIKDAAIRELRGVLEVST
jgi:hypothetical protein